MTFKRSNNRQARPTLLIVMQRQGNATVQQIASHIRTYINWLEHKQGTHLNLAGVPVLLNAQYLLAINAQESRWSKVFMVRGHCPPPYRRTEFSSRANLAPRRQLRGNDRVEPLNVACLARINLLPVPSSQSKPPSTLDRKLPVACLSLLSRNPVLSLRTLRLPRHGIVIRYLRLQSRALRLPGRCDVVAARRSSRGCRRSACVA